MTKNHKIHENYSIEESYEKLYNLQYINK